MYARIPYHFSSMIGNCLRILKRTPEIPFTGGHYLRNGGVTSADAQLQRKSKTLGGILSHEVLRRPAMNRSQTLTPLVGEQSNYVRLFRQDRHHDSNRIVGTFLSPCQWDSRGEAGDYKPASPLMGEYGNLSPSRRRNPATTAPHVGSGLGIQRSRAGGGSFCR
jgi:hypothetical protein